MQSEFQMALIEESVADLARVPKADLHNHADLGGRLESLNRLSGREFKTPPCQFSGFSDFESYIAENLHDFNTSKKGWLMAKMNTIQAAADDGVTILETSFHNGLATVGYDSSYASELASFAKRLGITLRPEIGLRGTDDVNSLYGIVEKNIATGFFSGIDVYGDDRDIPYNKLVPIYKMAKQAGLKLKAHVGEQLEGHRIPPIVEALELTEIQHGITASRSLSTMRWLAKEQIQLNLCPQSNYSLGITKKDDPAAIRVLYDNQVPITINTDDLLIFDRSISEQFLELYRSSLFGLADLDRIREQALK